MEEEGGRTVKMAKVYKISGGESGRCGCGHRTHRGETYWLIDGEKTTKSLCDDCGKKKGLRGAKVTAEELAKYWFEGEPLKEVVCVKLNPFMKESKNSLKREEMLEAAVDV